MGSLGTTLCLAFPIAVLCRASCLAEVGCQVIFPPLNMGVGFHYRREAAKLLGALCSLKETLNTVLLSSMCGLCVPASLSTGTSLKHGPSFFCRAVIHIEAANIDIPFYFCFLLGGDWAWMGFSYSNPFPGRRNPCHDITGHLLQLLKKAEELFVKTQRLFCHDVLLKEA